MYTMQRKHTSRASLITRKKKKSIPQRVPLCFAETRSKEGLHSCAVTAQSTARQSEAIFENNTPGKNPRRPSRKRHQLHAQWPLTKAEKNSNVCAADIHPPAKLHTHTCKPPESLRCSIVRRQLAHLLYVASSLSTKQNASKAGVHGLFDWLERTRIGHDKYRV